MDQKTPDAVAEAKPAAEQPAPQPVKKKSGASKVVIIILVVLFSCCVITLLAGLIIWPSLTKDFQFSINTNGTPEATIVFESEVEDKDEPETKQPQLTNGGDFKLGKPLADNDSVYNLVTVKKHYSSLDLNTDIIAGPAEDNVVYIAKYEGDYVLVLGFNNGLAHYKHMVVLEDNTCVSGEEVFIDFAELENPKPIAAGLMSDNMYINSACFIADDMRVIYSIVSDYEPSEGQVVNLVVDYSITKDASTVIFEKKLGVAGEYFFKPNLGYIYLDQIINGELVFMSEFACNACDIMDHANFAVNLATKKVMYLGEWLEDFKVAGPGKGTARQLEVVGEAEDCYSGDCSIREPGKTIEINLP